VDALEGRLLPVRLDLPRGAVPDSAEELRELGPAPAAAKRLRCLGVPEDTGLFLGEDAVARQRP
jgi:hypothetical protein